MNNQLNEIMNLIPHLDEAGMKEVEQILISSLGSTVSEATKKAFAAALKEAKSSGNFDKFVADFGDLFDPAQLGRITSEINSIASGLDGKGAAISESFRLAQQAIVEGGQALGRQIGSIFQEMANGTGLGSGYFGTPEARADARKIDKIWNVPKYQDVIASLPEQWAKDAFNSENGKSGVLQQLDAIRQVGGTEGAALADRVGAMQAQMQLEGRSAAEQLLMVQQETRQFVGSYMDQQKTIMETLAQPWFTGGMTHSPEELATFRQALSVQAKNELMNFSSQIHGTDYFKSMMTGIGNWVTQQFEHKMISDRGFDPGDVSAGTASRWMSTKLTLGTGNDAFQLPAEYEKGYREIVADKILSQPSYAKALSEHLSEVMGRPLKPEDIMQASIPTKVEMLSRANPARLDEIAKEEKLTPVKIGEISTRQLLESAIKRGEITQQQIVEGYHGRYEELVNGSLGGKNILHFPNLKEGWLGGSKNLRGEHAPKELLDAMLQFPELREMYESGKDVGYIREEVAKDILGYHGRQSTSSGGLRGFMGRVSETLFGKEGADFLAKMGNAGQVIAEGTRKAASEAGQATATIGSEKPTNVSAHGPPTAYSSVQELLKLSGLGDNSEFHRLSPQLQEEIARGIIPVLRKNPDIKLNDIKTSGMLFGEEGLLASFHPGSGTMYFNPAMTNNEKAYRGTVRDAQEAGRMVDLSSAGIGEIGSTAAHEIAHGKTSAERSLWSANMGKFPKWLYDYISKTYPKYVQNGGWSLAGYEEIANTIAAQSHGVSLSPSQAAMAEHLAPYTNIGQAHLAQLSGILNPQGSGFNFYRGGEEGLRSLAEQFKPIFSQHGVALTDQEIQKLIPYHQQGKVTPEQMREMFGIGVKEPSVRGFAAGQGATRRPKMSTEERLAWARQNGLDLSPGAIEEAYGVLDRTGITDLSPESLASLRASFKPATALGKLASKFGQKQNRLGNIANKIKQNEQDILRFQEIIKLNEQRVTEIEESLTKGGMTPGEIEAQKANLTGIRADITGTRQKLRTAVNQNERLITEARAIPQEAQNLAEAHAGLMNTVGDLLSEDQKLEQQAAAADQKASMEVGAAAENVNGIAAQSKNVETAYESASATGRTALSEADRVAGRANAVKGAATDIKAETTAVVEGADKATESMEKMDKEADKSSTTLRQKLATALQYLLVPLKELWAIGGKVFGVLESAVARFVNFALGALTKFGEKLVEIGNRMAETAQKGGSIERAVALGFGLQQSGMMVSQFGMQAMGRVQGTIGAYSEYEQALIKASSFTSLDKSQVQDMVFGMENGRYGQRVDTYGTKDITQALYYLASAIGDQSMQTKASQDATASLLTHILQGAAISQTDPETMIKGVLSIGQEFGLQPTSAKNIGQFQGIADMITTVAGKSPLEISDIVNSMKMVGPMANTLAGGKPGQGLSDTMMMTWLASEAGLRGTQVGRGLQMTFSQLEKPSNATLKAIDSITGGGGFTSTDFRRMFFDQFGALKGGIAGFMQQILKLSEVNGKQSPERLAQVLATMLPQNAQRSTLATAIRAMQQDGNWQKLMQAEQLGDTKAMSAIITKSFELTTNSITYSLQRMKNAWFQVQVSIVDSVSKVVVPVLHRFSNALEAIAAFIEKNSWVGKLVGGLTVLIGVLATAIGSIMSFSGGILMATRIFSIFGGIPGLISRALFSLIPAILMAIPVLLGIGAVALVVYEAWRKYGDAITARVKALAQYAADNFGLWLAQIQAVADELWSRLQPIMALLFDQMVAKLKNVFGSLENVRKAVVDLVAAFGTGFVSGLIEAFENLVEAATAVIDVLGRAYFAVRDFFLGPQGGNNAAKQMDALSTKLETLKNNIHFVGQIAGYVFGAIIAAKILTAIPGVTSLAAGILKLAGNLVIVLAKIIAVGLALAFKTAMLVANTVATLGLAAATFIWAAAQALVWGPLLAIAVILAIVTGLLLAHEAKIHGVRAAWDKAKDVARGFWDGLKPAIFIFGLLWKAISTVVEWTGKLLSVLPGLGGVAGFLENHFKLLGASIAIALEVGVIAKFISKFRDLGAVGELILKPIKAVVGAITNVFKAAWNAYAEFLNNTRGRNVPTFDMNKTTASTASIKEQTQALQASLNALNGPVRNAAEAMTSVVAPTKSVATNLELLAAPSKEASTGLQSVVLPAERLAPALQEAATAALAFAERLAASNKISAVGSVGGTVGKVEKAAVTVAETALGVGSTEAGVQEAEKKTIIDPILEAAQGGIGKNVEDKFKEAPKKLKRSRGGGEGEGAGTAAVAPAAASTEELMAVINEVRVALQGIVEPASLVAREFGALAQPAAALAEALTAAEGAAARFAQIASESTATTSAKPPIGGGGDHGGTATTHADSSENALKIEVEKLRSTINEIDTELTRFGVALIDLTEQLQTIFTPLQETTTQAAATIQSAAETQLSAAEQAASGFRAFDAGVVELQGRLAATAAVATELEGAFAGVAATAREAEAAEASLAAPAEATAGAMETVDGAVVKLIESLNALTAAVTTTAEKIALAGNEASAGAGLGAGVTKAETTAATAGLTGMLEKMGLGGIASGLGALGGLLAPEVLIPMIVLMALPTIIGKIKDMFGGGEDKTSESDKAVANFMTSIGMSTSGAGVSEEDAKAWKLANPELYNAQQAGDTFLKDTQDRENKYLSDTKYTPYSEFMPNFDSYLAYLQTDGTTEEVQRFADVMSHVNSGKDKTFGTYFLSDLQNDPNKAWLVETLRNLGITTQAQFSALLTEIASDSSYWSSPGHSDTAKTASDTLLGLKTSSNVALNAAYSGTYSTEVSEPVQQATGQASIAGDPKELYNLFKNVLKLDVTEWDQKQPLDEWKQQLYAAAVNEATTMGISVTDFYNKALENNKEYIVGENGSWETVDAYKRQILAQLAAGFDVTDMINRYEEKTGLDFYYGSTTPPVDPRASTVNGVIQQPVAKVNLPDWMTDAATTITTLISDFTSGDFGKLFDDLGYLNKYKDQLPQAVQAIIDKLMAVFDDFKNPKDLLASDPKEIAKSILMGFGLDEVTAQQIVDALDITGFWDAVTKEVAKQNHFIDGPATLLANDVLAQDAAYVEELNKARDAFIQSLMDNAETIATTLVDMGVLLEDAFGTMAYTLGGIGKDAASQFQSTAMQWLVTNADTMNGNIQGATPVPSNLMEMLMYSAGYGNIDDLMRSGTQGKNMHAIMRDNPAIQRYADYRGTTVDALIAGTSSYQVNNQGLMPYAMVDLAKYGEAVGQVNPQYFEFLNAQLQNQGYGGLDWQRVSTMVASRAEAGTAGNIDIFDIIAAGLDKSREQVKADVAAGKYDIPEDVANIAFSSFSKDLQIAASNLSKGIIDTTDPLYQEIIKSHFAMDLGKWAPEFAGQQGLEYSAAEWQQAIEDGTAPLIQALATALKIEVVIHGDPQGDVGGSGGGGSTGGSGTLSDTGSHGGGAAGGEGSDSYQVTTTTGGGGGAGGSNGTTTIQTPNGYSSLIGFSQNADGSFTQDGNYLGNGQTATPTGKTIVNSDGMNMAEMIIGYDANGKPITSWFVLGTAKNKYSNVVGGAAGFGAGTPAGYGTLPPPPAVGGSGGGGGGGGGGSDHTIQVKNPDGTAMLTLLYIGDGNGSYDASGRAHIGGGYALISRTPIPNVHKPGAAPPPLSLLGGSGTSGSSSSVSAPSTSTWTTMGAVGQTGTIPGRVYVDSKGNLVQDIYDIATGKTTTKVLRNAADRNRGAGGRDHEGGGGIGGIGSGQTVHSSISSVQDPVIKSNNELADAINKLREAVDALAALMKNPMPNVTGSGTGGLGGTTGITPGSSIAGGGQQTSGAQAAAEATAAEYYAALAVALQSPPNLADLQAAIATGLTTAGTALVLLEAANAIDASLGNDIKSQMQAQLAAAGIRGALETTLNDLLAAPISITVAVTTTVNGTATGGGLLGGTGIPVVGQAGATGGVVRSSSGITLVGERGPELVHLPGGSRVFTFDDTMKMLSEVTGNPVTNPNDLVNSFYSLQDVGAQKTIEPEVIPESLNRTMDSENWGKTKTDGSVHVNFHGDMHIRSDQDIKKLVDEIDRELGRRHQNAARGMVPTNRTLNSF